MPPATNEAMQVDEAVVLAQPCKLVKPSLVVFTPELLHMYYQRLFPYHFMHQWLCYDPANTGKTSKLFSKREFSFTIMIDTEEIYIRYQSFSSEQEFKKAILDRKPVKIDIGAVFSHPPKDHKSVQSGLFQPQQRELVFDIDLTDYDNVRNCGCSGANICTKCWKFMTMAVKIMEEGLREDFGFQHIAWFYSGRRGVHAWVCDKTARDLSNEARSAVASYFEINLGTEKNQKIDLKYPLHPMIKRAFKVLEPMFINDVITSSGHSLLATEEHWTTLLKTLPDAADPVKQNLMSKWKKSTSAPAEKWDEVKKHLEIFYKKAIGGGKSPTKLSWEDRHKLESWPVEIVFRYTYPRLDINVSKMQNHLLKSPFCVHPKTGRVCVPMRVQDVDRFDPFAVPTLPQLMQELDDYQGPEVAQDWKKTSLRPYFEPFQREFLEPMLKDLRKAQRDEKEIHAAVTGDF